MPCILPLGRSFEDFLVVSLSSLLMVPEQSQGHRLNMQIESQIIAHKKCTLRVGTWPAIILVCVSKCQENALTDSGGDSCLSDLVDGMNRLDSLQEYWVGPHRPTDTQEPDCSWFLGNSSSVEACLASAA